MVKKVKKTKNSKKIKKQEKPKQISNRIKFEKISPIPNFVRRLRPRKRITYFACKKLRDMSLRYDQEKNDDIMFHEYLQEKRIKDEELDKLLEDAEVDNCSWTSFTYCIEEESYPYFNNENYLFKNEEELKKAESKGPLLGKTIVLSGQLLIPKQYLKIILMNLGAKVTSEICGKTDILIHGNILEDGRNYTEGKKYKTAKEKKIKIYSDKE